MKKETISRARLRTTSINAQGDQVASLRRGLSNKYRQRPAHQQNDYLIWIANAKLDETKQKRILQMLEELKSGDRYMKMKWRRR
jgi:uncharacterized protein YdeI (YjbR/CyaY-like superfamily)